MKSRYPLIAAVPLLALAVLHSQNRPALTGQEQAISARMRQLRSLPDDEWTKTVAALASDIHQLPASPGKAVLIGGLGNLVTEGDAGHDTLQVVASTMAEVLRDSPNSSMSSTLAQLVRYEHLDVSVDNPGYRAAMAKLEAEDLRRLSPEFTLSDLRGVKWSLNDLRGKVVLVNFWATWCPPCRKEMPDMEGLYQRFGPRGLVILAISDEDAGKVEPFIGEHKYTYPILLDPGRKVNQLLGVEGIPKSFLYGRDGKLVAQAIDRRTERQFLEMLKLAGLD
ncbi:MAG: TlpA family protein disulfide reductase [Acidobacteriia bacterium]|nr:TlpA family protein disulfide reductase [Terriglobia bacterium]